MKPAAKGLASPSSLPSRADPAQQLAALKKRVADVETANAALRREVDQRRAAEEVARSQTRVLVQSLGMLAAGSSLDRFLGHLLMVTVQQLDCEGGTLWFPDPGSDGVRLHLEYVGGQVNSAAQSRHPAVLRALPVGGKGISTFPTDGPETYMMCDEIAGMPEENQAYVRSLGVHALLTVPMLLGREAVGWICVRSRRRDPAEMEEKVHLAEALANQATLAVQMARLGEQAREAAVLGERNRIARDIHDTLAQGFTGIILNLEAASITLRKQDADAARHHVETARGLAKACLDEARISVGALRPQQPTDLLHQLELQIGRVTATGVRARLLTRGEPEPLAPETQAELVRIAQESLTNVLRHARARSVELSLNFMPGEVRLCVADDGVGFDPAAGHEGFGLHGMRERAQRIGAQFIVGSRPGLGSRIETVLPLHRG
jgi:signal transduction histidine kinase